MLSLIALTALTATAQAETASVGLALRQADSLMTGVQATFTPPGPLQLHARLLGQAGPPPRMAEAVQHAPREAAITDNLGGPSSSSVCSRPTGSGEPRPETMASPWPSVWTRCTWPTPGAQTHWGPSS